ncbi:MAG: hypothetical protein ACYCYA_08705 [Actinomycetes bacterium]
MSAGLAPVMASTGDLARDPSGLDPPPVPPTDPGPLPLGLVELVAVEVGVAV